MSVDVTIDNFEEEILKADTVLVDFWAEWCGPCQAVSPVLEKISEERGIKLAKIDIDEQSELADKFGIMSIPTIMLFENGVPANSVIGAQPKTMLEQSLFN